MIALLDDLPLVQLENGRVFAFRCEWLREQIVKAAAVAGYRDWWLADHLAKSVTNYLATQYEANVLTTADLRNSVSEVLARIGYAEVADHFTPTRPARDISLLELATLADAYELAFFSHLREALTAELEDHVQQICVTQLGPAVKKLLGVKLFTEDCAALRDEIVDFSRNFIAHTNNAGLLIR